MSCKKRVVNRLFFAFISFNNILVKKIIISYNILERNELSHLYDEQTWGRIYNEIKNKYIIEFKKLEEKFEQIL